MRHAKPGRRRVRKAPARDGRGGRSLRTGGLVRRVAGSRRAGAAARAEEKLRLGAGISRFLLDLDPGVDVLLRWMRRRRTLPPPTRRVVIRRVGVVGILALWAILHMVTGGAVPWLW